MVYTTVRMGRRTTRVAGYKGSPSRDEVPIYSDITDKRLRYGSSESEIRAALIIKRGSSATGYHHVCRMAIAL